MSDLLQKARFLPRRKTILVKSLPFDVALAWVRDELTLSQIVTATGMSSTAVYQKLALTFREGVRTGHYTLRMASSAKSEEKEALDAQFQDL
jgi:hypothetical protein